MKTLSIIIKSLKEQIRSIWLLLLLLAMGPFFVLIYSLITDSNETNYKLIVINQDQGAVVDGRQLNYGADLLDYYRMAKQMLSTIPFEVEELSDREEGESRVKNTKADALIIVGSRRHG